MGTVRGGLRFSGRKHCADGFGGRQQSGVHGQRAVTRLNRIGDTDETHTPDLRANGFCWWPHDEPVLCSLLTRGLLAVVECHWLRRGIDLHHAGLSFRDTGTESNVSVSVTAIVPTGSKRTQELPLDTAVAVLDYPCRLHRTAVVTSDHACSLQTFQIFGTQV